MAARLTIAGEAIKEALHRWGGNVSGAARELGIRRRTLLERIEVMGIDLAVLRNAPAPAHMPTKELVGLTPERSHRPKRVVVSLRPDHLELLREARWDLQAILRREISEQELLHRFLDVGLQAWISEQLKIAGAGRKAQ